MKTGHKVVMKFMTIIVVSSLLFLTNAPSVYAYISIVEVPSDTEVWTDLSCGRFERKIDRKINRYQYHHETQIKNYHDRRDVMQNAIDTYSRQSFNVTKVTEDLRLWNNMTSDFDADYTVFINKLKEARTYSCMTARTQMLARIKEAALLRDVVDGDMVSMNDFYWNTAKVDLRELKRQKHITAL